MTVRDDRGDVKQTTTGFRGPLMAQSLASAKSKFLSLPLPLLLLMFFLMQGCRSWQVLLFSRERKSGDLV